MLVSGIYRFLHGCLPLASVPSTQIGDTMRRTRHTVAGITLALLMTVGLAVPASAMTTAPADTFAGAVSPPADDPAAVAEYLELLAAYRSSDVAARSGGGTGPCLSSAWVNAVPEGQRVSVYRKASAPYLVCVNAAQAVYDNEYKPLVSSAWIGAKYRDQLVCHIANAWDKTPWNLDSWRPNVGYPATVAAKCNPN